MSTTTEAPPVLPDVQDISQRMVKDLQRNRITADRLEIAPGLVLCHVPDPSGKIIVAGESEESPGGMPGVDPKAPIKVVKIGPNPFSEIAGCVLPDPWFKEGDMVYAPSQWLTLTGWKDERLVIVGRDDICSRLKPA